MKANEVSLNSFLSQTKTQFIIPVYQRNYDWTEHQCSQLFADILTIGNKPNETHFIGSIVFIHDGVYTSSSVKQLVVIDGQQRLTTFSLLYLALYKYAMKNGLEEKASEINETFLVNKFVKDDISKLKLKQSDVNARAFRFIMSDNDPADYREFSRVIENYNFFRQQITKDNFEVIQNGLNRLLFVEISLERGKDDPQRIFESLNSTGLELSQADLIRNYILMGLEPETQVRIFNNYWEIIESNARDKEMEESRVSDFIRDYLTYKSKKIPNKGKVYDEFKLRYTQRDSEFYQVTLSEIRDFSYHYHKLVNPKEEEDPAVSRELLLIKRLEINISFPFLTPVYEDYRKGTLNKGDFIRVLQLVQSYVWRRFIAGLPTNALNKIFMTLYGDIDKSDYVGSLERALCRKKGAQKFPSNKDIETALLEKDVYNIQSKNRVYFLELLENFNNREFVLVENPDITTEHIFPQTPDEKWFNELAPEELRALSEKYLNTIANLTLSGNNGSLGNKTFLEKKTMNRDGKEQGYNYSRLWLNQYLKQIDTWHVSNLMERFGILLDRFYKIWVYPTVDIDDDFDSEIEYNIFNAPDPRNRKLEYFIFRDEKVVEEEVSKMYYHVIKKLFEENPIAFNHQEVKSLIGLTSNPVEVRSPYSISPSYYVESNIDSNTKFRRVRALLSRFGGDDDLLVRFADEDLDGDDDTSSNVEFWQQRAGESGMKILRQFETLLTEIDASLHLSYKGNYIGILEGKRVKNFAIFFARPSNVKVAIKVPNPETWAERIADTSIQYLNINKKNGRMRFNLTEQDFIANAPILRELFLAAASGWRNSN